MYTEDSPVRINTDAKHKPQRVSLKYVIVFERTQNLRLLSCFQQKNVSRGLKRNLIYMPCFPVIA